MKHRKEEARARKYFDAREIDPEKVYTFGKPIKEAKLTAAQACAALAILLRRAGFVPVMIGLERIFPAAAFSLEFVSPEHPGQNCAYSFLIAKDHTFEDVEQAFENIRLLSQKGARRFMEVKRDEK